MMTRVLQHRDSSCPALCRASTSCFLRRCEDVDGLDKPGHDEIVGSSLMAVLLTQIVTKFTNTHI